MKDFTILVGNDINNYSQGLTWKQLLVQITNYCGISGEIDIDNKLKPFPLLYEEIFLSAIKKNRIIERDLKRYISKEVSKITQNILHERIRQLNLPHVMTTNYEFSIEGIQPSVNSSLVNERLYSIFRSFKVDETQYWHLHGDCHNPSSINLGYEHYCGQLQNMRNYIVSGTDYKSDTVLKKPLIKRLQNPRQINHQSWLDLFFTKDVYIFGLSLDFVESDLWWLLTYRARSKFYKNAPINNTIYYFMPKEFVPGASHKIELFKANDVKLIEIEVNIGLEYYSAVLDHLNTLKP